MYAIRGRWSSDVGSGNASGPESGVLIFHFELLRRRANPVELLLPLAAEKRAAVVLAHAEIRLQDLDRALHRHGIVLAHGFGRRFCRALRERLDQLLVPMGGVAGRRPPQQAEPDRRE